MRPNQIEKWALALDLLVGCDLTQYSNVDTCLEDTYLNSSFCLTR